MACRQNLEESCKISMLQVNCSFLTAVLSSDYIEDIYVA